MRLSYLIAAAATLFISTLSFAQCLPAETARIGGDIHHLATIDSNRILIANNRALEIYNVSNAAAPTFTGRITLNESIRKMKIVAGRAYVVTDDGTHQYIRVYTVSGASPVFQSTLLSGDDLDFDSSGNNLFVAQHHDLGAFTVTAMDVTPVDFPLFLGEISLPATVWYSPVVLTVQGTRAFLCAYLTDGARVSAINIANPASMSLLGVHDDAVASLFGPVAVSGNYAYVCDNDSLKILSLSNFPNFLQVGEINNIGAFDASVLGSTLFVASSYGGVRAYNVATPASPSAYTPFNTSGTSSDIVISGDRLYNADREGGVNILQIGNPSSIIQLGSIAAPFPSRVRDEIISGNTMYVLDELGLRIFSIANPDAPAHLGSFTLPDLQYGGCSSRTLGVHNTNAYITGCDGRLRVVSVANPAAQFLRADISLIADFDIAFYNNYAYFCGFPGLQIVDISNPSAPSIANTYSFAGVAISAEVQGSTLYLGTRDNGLWILSLADPISPQLIGFHAPPARGSCRGLQVAGDTAFVGRDRGLEILNIANPSSPQELAFDPTIHVDVKNPVNYRNGILHASGYLNNDYSDRGIHRYDVSSLTAPVIIGTLPGYFWSFAAGASRLYSGDGDRDDLVISSLQSQWKPAYRRHPANVAGCLDEFALFNVNVSANPTTVTYQWFKNNIPLSNGGRYVGADQANFTILDLVLSDAGSYTCVATNSCGSTTSNAAVLSFCLADFNCDQAVDFFDYLDFVDQFSAGQPRADFNRDEVIDFFDYLDFVDAFSTGCP